jgi:rubrerythrin
MMADARSRLLALLQLAYSGELAAAYAYRGHWRSLANDPAAARAILQVEEDEWHHRRLVGEMLARLGARPRWWREVRAVLIGRVLGLLCHVAGRFFPMFGAARLEHRNIGEYVTAARHAAEAGHADLIDCLLDMAELEWEHERIFRQYAQQHRLSRWFPLAAPPPPKATIRTGFAEAPPQELSSSRT